MADTVTAAVAAEQPAPGQRLTVADLTAYEHRYNLSHRVSGEGHVPPDQTVAEGRVAERQPWRGLQMVGSDLFVRRTYEAHARPEAPAHVSIIVLLEGRAELALGASRHTLTAGDGLLLAYDRNQSLRARHPADQRVRAVNLTLLRDSLENDPRLAGSVDPLFRSRGGGLWPVSVPYGLRLSLAEWIASAPAAPALPLMAEGLALQLVAQGLAGRGQALPGPVPAPRGRDWRLLERVREYLDEYPGEPHTLKALAGLACMSPSTLRAKFRRAYGRSVFDYLRERRLEQAHRALRDGLSVQQAANRAGYRHATNFATAFRQRYGLTPSAVR
ncbi:hypothetical protein KBTX_03373 [wastewater metagenome]|uniref:HTH araC/xylS-type domain-containing protein n=2 Tax=unclassified sequences TaxID=12908 RepID=A0A5B8RDB0_9ZZZZ|nr:MULTISPECIES: AraC family transcriptional regulator [Arhodomonas]MCS4504756.1 helix-turn-helix transcriptional regulator [Arhodomonas aquaeolei]QEA07029.1 hypothetical protein KBTEX_03373 [uncultured organism]